MRIFSRSLFAAALSVGALAVTASAALATTVLPAGAQFKGVAGTTTFTPTAGPSVSCTTSSVEGAVPAAPGNSNSGGPVSATLTSETFGTSTPGSCTTSNGFNATVTTAGTWVLTLNGTGPTAAATVNVPNGGAVISVAGGLCTLTVNASTVTGTFTNGTPSTLQITGGNVAFTPVGFCFGATSPAQFRGTYTLDTTAPFQNVTVTTP